MTRYLHPMTLERLFADVTETPRDWQIVQGGYIRRVVKGDWWCCPIVVLAKLKSPSFPLFGLYTTAARVIKLPQEIAHRIACAADYDGLQREPELRSRLLAACGLDTEGR